MDGNIAGAGRISNQCLASLDITIYRGRYNCWRRSQR